MKNVGLRLLKKRDGMTMVNVLAAFAVLLFVLLMFSQAVNLSLNIFRKSEDVRKNTEALYSSYYRSTTFEPGNSSGIEHYTFKDQFGKTFTLKKSSANSYSPPDADGITGKVYYFGKRKQVSG